MASRCPQGLVRGLLGKAFGSIGVSCHFCIFALSQGIPAVCLHEGDYSQKARAIGGFWRDGRLAIYLQKADVSSAVEQVSTFFARFALKDEVASAGAAGVNDWQKVFGERVRANLEYQQPLIPPLHEKVELPARSDP